MHQVAADLQLLLELHLGRLLDIRIAELLAVSARIVLHSLLQSLRYTNIIHDQTTLFIREHTIDAGNGLHQIMILHGLVDIHRGQTWHIESREPHIHDDGNLHRRAVLFEECSILLILLRLNDVSPLFFISVGSTCHNVDFIRPPWAHLQNLTVYLHGSILIIGYYHGLTRQFILAIRLVVLYDILTQTGDGIRMTEYLLQSTVILSRPVHLIFRGSFLCQLVKLLVKLLQGFLIQIQIDHATLIIYRPCSTISHRLRHIVDIDIVTEYLLGITVSFRNRCACESDKRGMRQRFAHQQGKAFLHLLGLGVPMLFAIL